MDVAWLQAEPVHRRQRADRIAALAVPHQLRLCRGTGCEVKQHRIIGIGRRVRLESIWKFRSLLERQPAFVGRGRANHDAHKPVRAEACEFSNLILRRYYRFGPATI